MTGRVDVPVAGGKLATYQLGAETAGLPRVLAIHGLTSSSRTWLATATALGDRATLIAPDLRGRGRSNLLPPPFGIAAHVQDMLAVLDHFGLEHPVVVGHSLGAYIAARLASEHPHRVSGVVLVDGGLRIPGSAGVEPKEFIAAFLGPTFERLGATFADAPAYRAWWRRHPAVAGSDVDPADLDEYADHDLDGTPPSLRSAVNPQVVRDDGLDLCGVDEAAALPGPAVLLIAPRGMVNDPNPMHPLPLARAWEAADPAQRQVRLVPDVNHYTIAWGRHGAQALAEEIITMSELGADDGGETFVCEVEIPKGTRNKYEYDEELGGIKFDRLLWSAATYPTDYGYIRGTLALDGDELDALVCLTEPTFPGCLIEVKPIGMFVMRDEKGPDEKILCVPLNDPYWNHYDEVDQLPPLLLQEIDQFFSIYKVLEPNKSVEVGGWRPRRDALRQIAESQQRYAARRSSS